MDISRTVRWHVETDPVLRGGLERGILNTRRTAKWLIGSHLGGCSEEAVMSALRRYPGTRKENLQSAHGLLQKALLTTRSDIIEVAMPIDGRFYSNLKRFTKIVDPSKGDILRVIQGSRGALIIIDKDKLVEFAEIFEVEEKFLLRGISELNLIFPEEARTTLGTLALVTSSLTMEGINILDLVTCYREHLVFVDVADSARALQVLTALTQEQGHLGP